MRVLSYAGSGVNLCGMAASPASLRTVPATIPPRLGETRWDFFSRLHLFWLVVLALAVHFSQRFVAQLA